MKKNILIALVVGLVLIVSTSTACAKKEGSLPILYVGDKWVRRVIMPSGDMVTTLEVTGEDVVNGKDCYVTRGTSTFNDEGTGSGSSLSKCEKKTMLAVSIQSSTMATTGEVKV